MVLYQVTMALVLEGLISAGCRDGLGHNRKNFVPLPPQEVEKP
jgi:hypothetical protein